jgi:DNA-binding transcriptional regulator YiaG
MGNPTPEMIKARRKAAKITQQELATLIHVSLDAVKKWEAGTRGMSAAMWALFELKSRDKLT